MNAIVLLTLLSASLSVNAVEKQRASEGTTTVKVEVVK